MNPNETSCPDTGEKPWLIVRLKNQLYAIDSAYVESISQLEQEVTKLPGMGGARLGVIKIREIIISLLDLRQLIGMTSLEQERAEFEQMLELRKQDHIHWVDELKRCLKQNDDFKLATDPHQCQFGRWYDGYKAENHSVAFHLNKIDEPHKKLHKTAEQAFACTRECEKCKREECLQTLLRNETDVYMTRVVGLLEQAKTVFNESYRKMCIVLSDGKSTLGVLVDAVLSVEPLFSFTESEGSQEKGAEPIVSFVAQRANSTEQVLILNQRRLLGTE